ncbi:MAG: UbiX family flavin prenyltransferase [Rikenellaceae bacterium]
MKVIVAITAASGAIYARQTVELLLADQAVERIALIYSDAAKRVAELEGITLPTPDAERVVEYSNDDMFASVASGSARWDSMIIVPCSVGTLARVATGVSDSLISRAADVMLKERRRLVMVVRETPLSLIHLRNMITLTEAGAIILPASPSYYMGVESIEELALSVSSRAVSMAGGAGNPREWRGDEQKNN